MGLDVFRKDLFAGKNAFVTGGSSGIGFAIASALVRLGCKVAINGRSKKKLQTAVDELSRLGSAMAAPADVRNYSATAEALRSAREQMGPLDILVCSAAGNFPAPATALTSDSFNAVLQIDVLGTFHACHAAFEHLRRPGACVLNISAGQAQHPAALQTHVCAAKAGVEMLTRVLALEWGTSGVRVNSLAPGPVDGTEGMARLTPTAEIKVELERQIPLQRFGRLEEIAACAVYLCSDAASYVSGTAMVCDGGASLGGMATVFTRGQLPPSGGKFP